MKFYIFPLLFSVTFHISCNQSGKSNNKTILLNDTTKTFTKEIPKYKDGGVDLFYTMKKDMASQLKLHDLEAGFDSLQIRIWYDYALSSSKELLIIERTNSMWSAARYEMKITDTTAKVFDSIISTKIKLITPKSGWENFTNKLFDLKIMTLPNMENIPGLEDNWTDGVTYSIEISTKKQYRFYNYHLPNIFASKFWQAKNMTQILDLIGLELGS